MRANKKTPLWSLNIESSSHTSYLFGTMHVRDARAFKLLEIIKSKLSECDHFYAEVNMEFMQSAIVTNAQKLQNGLTLSSLLGQKKYSKSKKVIARHFDINLDIFNDFLPILTVNQLLSFHLNKEHKEALDQTLYNIAKLNNCQVHGLETMEEHLSVLGEIPIEDQVKQFKSLIKSPAKFKKKIDQMADVYETGDIYKLYKSSKKSMGQLRKLMIYDRNRLMSKVILEKLGESSFYAVGAGHLAGKYGLIALLKTNGVSVKPILKS